MCKSLPPTSTQTLSLPGKFERETPAGSPALPPEQPDSNGSEEKFNPRKNTGEKARGG